MDLNESAFRWLLTSDEPSIRYFTLVDLLGVPDDSLEVQEARRNIPNGPRLKALMQGQRPNGDFGVGPYGKWTGAHWRLISLVELGVPYDDPRVRAAVETVLQGSSVTGTGVPSRQSTVSPERMLHRKAMR
jgi:hypothetical protein